MPETFTPEGKSASRFNQQYLLRRTYVRRVRDRHLLRPLVHHNHTGQHLPELQSSVSILPAAATPAPCIGRRFCVKLRRRVSVSAWTAVEGSLVLDNYSVTSRGRGQVNPKATHCLSGSVSPGQTGVPENECSNLRQPMAPMLYWRSRAPQQYQGGKVYPINRPAPLFCPAASTSHDVQCRNTRAYDASQVVNVKLDPDYTVYGD